MISPIKSSSGQSLIPSNDFSADSLLRGLLVPRIETVLSSQMAGKIEKINVEEGDRFKKGQALVEFDCKIEQTELKRAVTELEAARKTMGATRSLAQLKSISGLDVAMAEAKVLSAEAEASVRQAVVERCTLQAPFDGRVVEIPVSPYQTVRQAEPLLKILDDRDLRLEVIVPSSWLAWLKEGEPFAIVMDETGKTYQAKVSKIGARIDPVSQSLKVLGRIEGNHPELMAGMSGAVTFPRTAAK